MIDRNKYEVDNLKGKLGQIRDWMYKQNFPSKLIFYLLGIASTIWFLVRVIPKPSRASYPCMKVAAPLMSGFVVYLLSLGSIAVALRKIKQNIFHARHIASGLYLCVALVALYASIYSGSQDVSALNSELSTGPDDGPNQPMGKAVGINPGRVVWAWDPMATNENCSDYYFKPENNNQEVISKMFQESVKKLTEKSNVHDSWDAMFKYFNNKKHNVNNGYKRGEKIFIKINQTSSRGRLKQEDKENGYYYPPLPALKPGEVRKPYLGTCETNQFLVLEILRQLINECGVRQSDIAIGDPQNPLYGHNYDAWSKEFPDIVYIDKHTSTQGRTIIHSTKNDLLYYSDKRQTDKLVDVIENADYLINVANLKPHLRNGITLTAKNHFGSHSRNGAYHLHYSLVSPIVEGKPTNGGYNKYRVLVDIMGSKYLGQNTLLFVVDGLYAGGASEGGPPVKYHMSPFNNDYCNSIFISEDQIALESVCYDFLRTEWNGINKHDPSNNRLEAMPNVKGVDDYLHQGADSTNWPAGIIYDPDNCGKPIPSLGVHEHWNNPEMKQYSRNLGKSYGIELVSIPDYLVGPEASKLNAKSLQTINTEKTLTSSANAGQRTDSAQPEKTTSAINNTSLFSTIVKRAFNEELIGKKFFAAVVDDNNGTWFLTDAGILNGRFVTVPANNKIQTENILNFSYELTTDGPVLWFATTHGAIKAVMPVMSDSEVSLYTTENSGILSDSVLSVAVGRNNLQWFGTKKGISAFSDNKWLTPSYEIDYPKDLFNYFPITVMATSQNGDSLYAGTLGAGVARVYRNKVDGISGASSYAQWGPIILPSDNVYSICITSDGAQWFGTDKGVARHTGYNTLENWTVFNTENGLVDNFVNAIAEDLEGRLWFGTKGGLSVLTGSEWKSYTVKDGLVNNNILFIKPDKGGRVFLGTDNGLMVYYEGQLICYQ